MGGQPIYWSQLKFPVNSRVTNLRTMISYHPKGYRCFGFHISKPQRGTIFTAGRPSQIQSFVNGGSPMVNNQLQITRLLFSYSLLSSLYICREASTNPHLFMQNKPNLPNAKMNVISVLTKHYENHQLCGRQQIKPNIQFTNPSPPLSPKPKKSPQKSEKVHQKSKKIAVKSPIKPIFSRDSGVNCPNSKKTIEFASAADII